MLLERHVDGLIVVANWLFVDIHVLADLNKREIPAATIGWKLPQERISSVMVDNEAGGRLALEHLYQLGHRRIAFIRGPKRLIDSGPRWRGIQKFAQSVGLAFHVGAVPLEVGHQGGVDHIVLQRPDQQGRHQSAVLAGPWTSGSVARTSSTSEEMPATSSSVRSARAGGCRSRVPTCGTSGTRGCTSCSPSPRGCSCPARRRHRCGTACTGRRCRRRRGRHTGRPPRPPRNRCTAGRHDLGEQFGPVRLLGRHGGHPTVRPRRRSDPVPGTGIVAWLPSRRARTVEVERYRTLAEAAVGRVIMVSVSPDRLVPESGRVGVGIRGGACGGRFTAARRIGKLLLLDVDGDAHDHRNSR